ncbi:hypothetical protein LZ30DRAFT_737831 [Colletotrichum cereale]|nr:hypothetical protein LZ30DRAFT_737831 [Colletotrichum cereale]
MLNYSTSRLERSWSIPLNSNSRARKQMLLSYWRCRGGKGLSFGGFLSCFVTRSLGTLLCFAQSLIWSELLRDVTNITDCLTYTYTTCIGICCDLRSYNQETATLPNTRRVMSLFFIDHLNTLYIHHWTSERHGHTLYRLQGLTVQYTYISYMGWQ